MYILSAQVYDFCTMTFIHVVQTFIICRVDLSVLYELF